ncbi:hypothetical protein INR49_006379 [Caranx melampygus]|nr:hypothetical protein INR49_006379 [Caranx melampygus]
MIGREIALEALGVLCNAEVIVVNQSDESRGSSGDGSGVAGLFLKTLHHVFGNDNVPAVKPQGRFGDGSGGAELFCIDQLIPRVLEADQRRFTGHLQSTNEKKEIKRVAEDVSKDTTTGQIKLKIAIDEEELFDPRYDYDFTNLKDTETYYRGGEEYERPCGYTRFALKVLGKYEDDTWLGHAGRGTSSVEGEWPVSYHGTKEWSVDPIIKGNLKLQPAEVQQAVKELCREQSPYGRGIYSTPHISVAEAETYATTFTSDKDKKKYKVILQNRINPKYREKCEKEPRYYLIRVPEGTSDEEEKKLVNRAIRPYGLLIKEPRTPILETSKAPDLYNISSKMIGREIALEGLGVLCNAEVIVVNQSDESRGSSDDGSGVAGLLFKGLQYLFGTDNDPAVKPQGRFGDGSGGAELFCIDQLIPRVLEADQRRTPAEHRCKEGNQRVKEDVGKDPTTGQIKLKIAIDEEEFFDPGYDYDFTDLKDTETYYRGGEEYERPCGYTRFALKVLGKYEDDTWLGHAGRVTSSVEGEWPVSYHGTEADCVDPIIKGNLKAGGGAMYGRGIYSTPHISVAEEYATSFTSDKDGKKYNVILQNRINPMYREKHYNDEYWLIEIPEGKSDEEEKELVNRAIRPYGLLIKEV